MLQDMEVERLMSLNGLDRDEILETYHHFQLLLNNNNTDDTIKLSKGTAISALQDRNIESISPHLIELILQENEFTFEQFLEFKKKLSQNPIAFLFETKSTWTKSEFVDFVVQANTSSDEWSRTQLEERALWSFTQLDTDGKGSITSKAIIDRFI